MRKLLTLAFALLLCGSLAIAQDTGGDKAAKGGKKATATTATKGGDKDKDKDNDKDKKGHKGGKKSKKGSSSTTPPPK